MLRLVSVVRPKDALFAKTLAAILKFQQDVPGCRIPLSWYSLRVSAEYHGGSPGMLLLAVVDEAGALHGHCLGLIENSYERRMAWCYQAWMDPDVPRAESHRIIAEAIALLKDWGRKTGCVALGMATMRPKGMMKLTGFTPTVTLMELDLDMGEGVAHVPNGGA